VHSPRSVVVHATRAVSVAEGRWDERISLLNRRERGAGGCGSLFVLLDALRVNEEEELVLNDWAADEAAELIALERSVEAACSIGKTSVVVLEVIEDLAVEAVGSVEVTSPETSWVERFN